MWDWDVAEAGHSINACRFQREAAESHESSVHAMARGRHFAAVALQHQAEACHLAAAWHVAALIEVELAWKRKGGAT
jgi:hypothetical protein